MMRYLRNGEERVCAQCRRRFRPRSHNQRFCSFRCSRVYAADHRLTAEQERFRIAHEAAYRRGVEDGRREALAERADALDALCAENARLREQLGSRPAYSMFDGKISKPPVSTRAVRLVEIGSSYTGRASGLIG